jgi:hypothetical protein
MAEPQVRSMREAAADGVPLAEWALQGAEASARARDWDRWASGLRAELDKPGRTTLCSRCHPAAREDPDCTICHPR